MVGDVLDALAATAAIEVTIVVTREPQAGEAALASRATVIEDDSEAGQSAAAMLGVAARSPRASSGCCACPATARHSTPPS